ncbi:MAG TPA: heme-binding protein [Bradyrhizobium sp.]|nr:heme-binding protein [Bradyrhizobium sp.]
MTRAARYPALAALLLALGASSASADNDAIVTYKSLSPDVALEAAQAALKQCRDNGFQVAVAVVDRFGQPQVMLRDRFAGLPASDTATRKAYTALGFHAATSDLAKRIASGKMDPGLARLPNVAMLAGGLVIEAGGAVLGGIGVAGAPGGDKDEACAKAGLDAIRDRIDF